MKNRIMTNKIIQRLVSIIGLIIDRDINIHDLAKINEAIDIIYEIILNQDIKAIGKHVKK